MVVSFHIILVPIIYNAIPYFRPDLRIVLPLIKFFTAQYVKNITIGLSKREALYGLEHSFVHLARTSAAFEDEFLYFARKNCFTDHAHKIVSVERLDLEVSEVFF